VAERLSKAVQPPLLNNIGGEWALSPDGRLLAIYGSTKALYNSETGQLLRPLAGPTGTIRSLHWSPNSQLLAGVGGDLNQESEIFVWRARDGLLVSRLVPPLILPPERQPAIWRMSAATWLPDNRTLCVSNADDCIRFWDVPSGRVLRTVPRVPSGALSPDSRYCAAVHLNAVGLWDTRTARLRGTVVALDKGDWFVLSPDGHYRGPPVLEQELVYVVVTDDGQETLTPEEFRQKYGWQNDPSRAKLLAE
jgi:WD40 repeat protein